MTLMRRGRDPLAGFGNLQEVVRDMLATWPFGEREALSIADWAPSCNVSETAEEYRIEAELPGVKQEDFEVKVDDRVLTLRGERSEEKEEKGKKYHRVESSYGSFMRSFTLPRLADALADEEEGAEGDVKTGLGVLRRALEAPLRQIALNSGADPGVVVDRLRSGSGDFGFDASTGEYVDLAEAGIIDPAKVVRVALENAISVAGTLLLTEGTLTEIEEKTRDVGPAMPELG